MHNGDDPEELVDGVDSVLILLRSGFPSASSASARWTAVSCSARRGQKRAWLSLLQLHTGVSGSAPRNADSITSAPSANHAG
ncbi:hypothetical protein [Haloactinospora alba]|uniref:hypothetical protein n=1 Tax=Haloactinospora alba TaxID=405555 RepID=UPI001FE5F920|nr:hypothetical protein [Haloactinospora alba]